jgi:hypothetical protein
MKDLNAFDLDHAMSMIAGTARSMDSQSRLNFITEQIYFGLNMKITKEKISVKIKKDKIYT